MNKNPNNDLQEILRPIESLISKSEKAQQKLTPGTWQHSMLRDNLKALHIAYRLMNKEGNETNDFTRIDLQDALKTLDALISKVEKNQSKFLPGTSQYTLQRSRLKSLRIASETISTFLEGL
jgi:hypothetical protein